MASLMKSLDQEASFSVGPEGEIISANRMSLALASHVFHSMFTRLSHISKDLIIPCPDVIPSAFHALLRFIQCNQAAHITVHNWAPILYVSRKYDVSQLKELCVEFAWNNCTNLRESLSLYDMALKHSVLDSTAFIEKALITFISESSGFIREIQNSEELRLILSLDDLKKFEEIDLFQLAVQWAADFIETEVGSGLDIRNVLGPALYSIRFPLISQEDFQREVLPSGVLSGEEIESLQSGDTSCFISRPRGDRKVDPRRSHRYRVGDDHVPLGECHSVTFLVDKPVLIHGLDICCMFNRRTLISGSITLRLKDGGRILGMHNFENNPYGASSSTMYFDEPIRIRPDTEYVASTDLDILNRESFLNGLNTRNEVIVDGVKWKFLSDDCNNQFNIGQIPCILFSRLN